MAADSFLILLTLCMSYFMGSIPFGIIVSKVFGITDLRKVGSGNIGATNAFRAKKSAGAITLLLDTAKGAIAISIVKSVSHSLICVSALLVIMGHMFPIWLGFKGGKGVATFLGVTLVITPLVSLAFIALWM